MEPAYQNGERQKPPGVTGFFRRDRHALSAGNDASDQVNGRADAIGDEGLGHRPRDGMDRPPAGAVRRYQNPGADRFERRDGGGNEWLEHPSGEVKSADHRVYPRNTGQSLGVTNGVDDTGVPATGDDDEA